ncbi:MAG: glycosyltransferase [Arthrospira sp. PLM2.Bin9]|nr:MAG: glycosyltransferase [Arthrospira sp. PLM2.Bin9]
MAMVNITQSPVLIITGMHRSGTSLLAALLQQAGLNLGENLLGSNRGNIRGHFEDLEILDFHKEILRSHNLNSDGWLEKLPISVAESFREKAREIIAKKSVNSLWGWKEPRTCLFLDFWRDLLPHGGFIFVYRSPWEVVDSLYRRGTDTLIISQPEIAILTWIHYNQNILEFSDRFPDQSLIIHLHQLTQFPQTVISAINHKFNLNLNPITGNLFQPQLLKTDISETFRPGIIKKFYPEAIDIYLNLDSKATPLNAEPSLSWGSIPPWENSQTWLMADWLEVRQQHSQNQHLETELDRTHTRLHNTQIELERYQAQLQILATRLARIENQQKSDSSTFIPPHTPPLLTPYQAWLRVNQWNHKAQQELQARLKRWGDKLPKISVIMPVYNPPIQFLETAIYSVINQVYHDWELCIADDASSHPEVRAFLENISQTHPKIKVIFREENGNISEATNTAIRQATGEFLLFLDHDDELTLDALGEVAVYIAEHPETDIIYSDDDKIDQEGQRFSPQFKPDWSPELLLSYMYFGHLLTIRKTICDRLGGMRIGFEGSQDYDLVLRVTEITTNIAHIPLILYHWRVIPGSTAASGSAKPHSFIAAQNAIQEALERRKINGTVYQQTWAIQSHCGIFNIKFPDEGPPVTIIIPTKNQRDLLQTCLESLAKTSYHNYQVMIIDNHSDDIATLEYLGQLPHRVVKLGNIDGKFNFAYLMNEAAKLVDTDYILFLNNDTAVISPNWLSQMMGYIQINQVGTVGAKLIFPNQTIQHGGVIFGLHHGLVGHAFKLVSRLTSGYLWSLNTPKNYSGVTAACLLTPRDLFLSMGGFNDTEFGVTYNDVDYCHRLSVAGWRSVYCPDAELIHREGVSRGQEDDPQEVATFREKYRGEVDRFYSPHLSLDNEQFVIQPRRLLMGKLTRKLRVLMVSNALDLTGAPLHQFDLAVEFTKTDIIEPLAFCLTDGILKPAYQNHQIPITVYGSHPLQNVYRLDDYHNAITKLASEVSKYPIDVIYINTIDNFFWVDCAAKMGIPCIWNIHESQPHQNYAEWLDSFGPEIARRGLECFGLPYRVVFVSDASRNQYLSLNGSHNFTVIHNGLNRQKWEAQAKQWTRETARQEIDVSPTDIVLLLLGTVCDRKGQQDLPLALSLLSPELQQLIQVFIVGDRPSPYSDKLHSIILGLPDHLRRRIKVIPETPDTAKYYQAADLFIFTSRIESFPRVILEAMATQLPIISTPVFGVKEQLKSGVNALFYQPGNIQELAIAITSMLRSPQMRSHFAKNSPQVLQGLTNFSEMVAAYQQLLQEAYLTSANISETPSLSDSPNSPLVTVFIPLHNGETYLAPTLKSLASQTYSNLEVIIADDSSSDRSLAIVKLFRRQYPHQISLFQHQSALGLAQNCNFGLSQAKGKYIKFLFQDDILESDCIEKLVELAETDDKIGLVFSKRSLILSESDAENPALMKIYQGCQDLHKSWSQLESVQWGTELLSDPNILEIPLNKIGEPSVVLIRREVFNTVGGFDPGLRQLVDLELWLRILTKYKVGFVNQTLSHFRLHLQQQTLKNAYSGVSDQVKFYHKLAFDPGFNHLNQHLRMLATSTYFVLTERYHPLEETAYKFALDQLRKVRQTIAETWIKSPLSVLEKQYKGLLGKSHKMLLNTSIKYHPLTPTEIDFVTIIKSQLELGFDNLNYLQYLISFQLYCWGDEIPQFPELSLLPHWLIQDTVEFLLKLPAYFPKPQGINLYGEYLQKLINFIHHRVVKYPKSQLWNTIAILFTNCADLTILSHQDQLETVYRQRVEILSLVMKLQNHSLTWEFPNPTSRELIKLGVIVSHLKPTPETLLSLSVYEYLPPEFQVKLYCLNETGNALENYCKQHTQDFVKLPDNLENQVNLIRGDDLDMVLICGTLTNTTTPLVLLALHRLARIQLNFSLSPVVTEFDSIDYQIVGDLINSQNNQNPQQLTIPGCGYCWSPAIADTSPRVNLQRHDLGIAENATVFISAVSLVNITSELVESWGEILSQVKNSVILLSPFLTNPEANYLQKTWLNYYSQIMGKFAIDPQRILILNLDKSLSRSDFRNCLKIANIYLDSYPVSDIISIYDALKVPLPIVVKDSIIPHHTAGAAILRDLGLAELVSRDEHGYMQLAIALGNHRKFREQYSDRLQEKLRQNPAIYASISYSENLGDILKQTWKKSATPPSP